MVKVAKDGLDTTRDTAEEEVSDAAIESAMHGQLSDKQIRLLEELDRETHVRKPRSPLLTKVFTCLCIAVSLYHFVTAFIGTPVVLEHRSLHVGMMLVLGFLMYPFSGKSDYSKPSMLDWLLVAASAAVPLYIAVNYLGVVERAGNPNVPDLIVATLLVLLVLEATRRSAGMALPVLSLVFIAYGLFGRGLPGLFGHRGYTWMQLSNHFFANTEGIYGTSVSVAASYIFLFILFGAIMSKSGMGLFFNDMAMALAGHSRGGPAKVAVLASGLLGSINGSAVANVVTTGAFTIPLMKKMGYAKEFAGAVEASASVGGQLLPPVMGAAAFIMAEILGMSYSTIIIHAAVPALLYYLGIIIQVHLRAGRTGLVGLPRERLPKAKAVLKERGHLLIPIGVLLYLLLFSGVTVIYAAVITIVSTIVVAMFRKNTRMGLRDILDAFADGARQTVSVALACACVGIIIGVASKTGFGLTMANAIITMGSHSLLFTLFFTMVTCMILGMGVPSIPAYIITATIAAPALAKLGIPALSAHMFSFYFAMFANLTPPVALAAFAAAGVSGGDPVKTGFAAVKLALAGFIVPYMFIYSPQLLLIDTTLAEGLRVTAGACLGVFLIGTAVEGYLFTFVHPLLRTAAFVGAFCLIDSGLVTDLIGLGVLVLLLTAQHFAARRQQAGAGG
ncbi:MAG: TRAP transporter permease [Desulfovibrio sp.]|jgi:TRAP transporter 4TM/12TM fusion protein|nr:TRAP transporter permease [Desulfovibrio sp.]